MSNIQLYHGDCLEILKIIPEKSIDMILSDLPYGKTQCKWDIILPMDILWAEYSRIIKDNGAICLFAQEPFSSMLITSNLEMFRYQWIWEKTKAGGFLNARRMPMQAHEIIDVFYKKLPTYNPQMESGKPYIKKAITNGEGNCYGKFERIGKININKGERFPRSVIKMSNDNHKSLHPTQKPVELCEYLIKTYTNENMLVLDSCIGSGTTGVACCNLNRNFIGIELNENYFNIAKTRIESKNQKEN